MLAMRSGTCITSERIVPNMKKIAVTGTALALALTMAITGCGPKTEDKTESTTETVAAEESEETTQTDVGIKWTEDKTAEEAAKAAGLSTFGVMKQVKLGDIEFKDPKFAHAEGVAQAYYEIGATGLFVRKADGKHTAPLSDRDLTEFAEKWKKNYEGFDVMMYGASKGAATVFTWVDGTKEYGVTYQGLGGEEMTMSATEVQEIVKAIKEAEAGTTTDKSATESTQQGQGSQTQGTGSYIGEDRAKEIAYTNAGQNEANTTWSSCELKEGGDAPHYLVTFALGDTTYTYEIDAYTGDIWTADTYTGSENGAAAEGPALSESEAISIAESTSGGSATNCYPTKSPDYGYCWYVATNDADGNLCEYFVTDDGNAYLIEQV